jgi:hypothetical protein
VDGYEPTVVFNVSPSRARPGQVHLCMSDNGYLRSDDGGLRYRNNGVTGLTTDVHDVDASPANPDRVYAVGVTPGYTGSLWTSNQVFVSDDAGDTWKKSPMTGLPASVQIDGQATAPEIDSVAADPADPQTVYVAVSGPVQSGQGGPYRSTDGGQSFAWFGAGLPSGAAHFFDESFWSKGRQIVPLGSGYLICFSRLTPGTGVYRWDPSQASWSSVAPSVSGTAVTPTDLAVDWGGAYPGTNVLLTSNKGIFLSTTHGTAGAWTQTWTGQATFAAFDPLRAGGAAAAVGGTTVGMILSADGGKTWGPIDQDLPTHAGLPAYSNERLVIASPNSGAFYLQE